MTAHYIASLAFGLIVTMTGAAFFAIDWIVTAAPSAVA
jgi:hypothetical protein